ncbi:lamin tail domain-containing protein [Candidatus Neomarinimicrobiota bacterium]
MLGGEFFNRIKIFFIYLTIPIIIGIGGKIYGQGVYINEFLASNVTTNPDIVDFDDYSDWIELYNSENSAIDLSGYYLTDDLSNPTKWRIPDGTFIGSKGFIRFWADGMDEIPGSVHIRPVEPFNSFTTTSYHLNFRLSRGGEELGLVNPDEVIIDAVEFGLQIPDVSFGRKPDGEANWFLFGEPTPGESNTTQGTLNPEFSSTPEFSIAGGFYNGSQSIILSSSSPNAEIYYTVDGSKPMSNSPQYSTPLTISNNSVLRSRIYEDGKLPGPIITQSYFIDENLTLPVLSIAVYPETFWDQDIGIYQHSYKGMEVPINLEYFESNGTLAFSAPAGIRISGQGSYLYPQKPFTISTKDRFGAGSMDYQIFPDRELSQFTDIYLRNSGTPDNRHTLFRDALQHTIMINQMDLDCQAYQPALTFINGQYWGIYNIREKENASYLAAHHKIDPTNIDYLEYDFSRTPVVIEGDLTDYLALLDFFENNSLVSTENYNYIKSQIHIDEYINYQIAEIYCDNINWLNTNVRWWREKTKHSKWRWILVDMDWGFGTVFPNFTSSYETNSLLLATSAPGTRSAAEPWTTLIFRKLLENSDFRDEFIQRFAGYLNTTFASERVVGIVDSLQNYIGTEMPRHIDRWKNDPSQIWDDPPIPNIYAWNSNVEIMREFAENRTNLQWDHIIDFFSLSGIANLSLNINSPGKGKIVVNDVTLPENFVGYYFKDIPLRTIAIPQPGYKFIRWEGLSDSESDSISLILTSDAELTAIFEPSNESILPTVISANRILDLTNSPYHATSDISIDPEVTLEIQAGVEILMPQDASLLVYGNIIIDGNELNPVIIQPDKMTGATNWGALCILDATDSSRLSHVAIIGATNGPDNYNHMGAISSYRSNVSLDNINITDAPFPIFIQYGNAEVRNSTLHSTKTSDLINIKYAETAIVEGCNLRGYVAYDSDAIDYDQISNGTISGNRIYNFSGFNSDGIDLGESCKNIFIENNLIFNCADKGISVGQSSTTTIRKNIIVDCAQGIGIKDDSSFAFIDQNTFYSNDYAVASFEKNFGDGGGHAEVMNSIISNSRISPFFVDDLSIIDVSYSLSDTEKLQGENNLFGDPLFTNNFNLKYDSPAIDAGDPAGAVDPDGSRIDMGAYPFDEHNTNSVLISEIHYNPINGDEYEFIELYNSAEISVSLYDYRLRAENDYIFPQGTEIAAGEYIVVANNANNFHIPDIQIFEGIELPLPNTRLEIQLFNSDGNEVDFIDYDNNVNWASAPNGQGPSLELRSVNSENLYSANWQASTMIGGSPGQENAIPDYSVLVINEFLSTNESNLTDEYDEYEDWIEIYNGGQYPVDIGGLYISDDFTDPLLYKIPITNTNQTTIQPNEHILIWADRDPEQGVLHTNFRLEANGEQLGLFQLLNNDTIFIDTINFTIQTVDISFGRIADGDSEWKQFNIPTPDKPNTMEGNFDKGLLLVNGVSIDVYGEQIKAAYNSRAFHGKYPISFWDCLEEPDSEYPYALPAPLGHGPIPFDIMSQFSTIIWIGNNYGGDHFSWKFSPIKEYLQAGGNLILLSRMGHVFIDEELKEYMGIDWTYTSEPVIQNYQATHPGLIDIDITGSQSLSSLFRIIPTGEEATLLFLETQTWDRPQGLGVWFKPKFGGAYRAKNGGQFVFISGRPYRFDNNDLRSNIEFILENFFNEKERQNLGKMTSSMVITEFRLGDNYPNPFNPVTMINYDVPYESKVLIKIHNILGQEVRTLLNEVQSMGSKIVLWDGTDNSRIPVSSGVYFYSINTDNFTRTKKMLLLR